MKKTIILIFLLKCGIGFSQNQTPFFEQKAFDFYQNIILDSFPVNGKITIYRYATEFYPYSHNFSTPDCLTGIVWENNTQFKEIDSYVETQLKIDSNRFELDFSELNKKQFKIKKYGKGNYPKLFITPPNIERDNTEKIFVNIYEMYLRSTVNYHFEFNQQGEILNWCRTKNEIIISH